MKISGKMHFLGNRTCNQTFSLIFTSHYLVFIIIVLLVPFFPKFCGSILLPTFPIGFNHAALALIKQKVQEEASKGSRVLLSLTFDEMAIRKYITIQGWWNFFRIFFWKMSMRKWKDKSSSSCFLAVQQWFVYIFGSSFCNILYKLKLVKKYHPSVSSA